MPPLTAHDLEIITGSVPEESEVAFNAIVDNGKRYITGLKVVQWMTNEDGTLSILLAEVE